MKQGTIVDSALYKRKIVESTKRLDKLPAYIAKKEWYNVKDELTRQVPSSLPHGMAHMRYQISNWAVTLSLTLSSLRSFIF